MAATSAEVDELERKGSAFSAAGQYAQSVEIWRQLNAKAPEEWRFALALAADLRHNGEREASDEVYRRGARQFPNAYWILYHWALAAFHDEDLDRAEQRALRLLDLCAQTMKEPLGLLGDIAFARRDFGEAERLFQRALRIDANDAYASERLSQARRFASAARALDPRGALTQAITATADYGVLAISLDSRGDRYDRLREKFRDSPVSIERVPGVFGSYLPDLALQQLCRTPATTRKGTAGCFLAHVAAWETCLRRGFDRCLILEDDTKPIFDLPVRFDMLGVPPDFDLCFANSRMQPRAEADLALGGNGFSCHDPVDTLAYWPPDHNAPGGDGYFVSASGARKLLKLVERDGFNGDVDWRLVGYSARKGSASRMPKGSVAADVLRHFEALPDSPLRAYALYPSLIFSEGRDSDRLRQNVG